MSNFSRNILTTNSSNYEVINLFDARQSPGGISGSRTFDKPVYVDKVYLSWFRSFSDYAATVTVTITLEDGTSKTIYSVTNSKVVGGENAVITINDKIKSIKFYMTSGSVGGNGIGYQLTFIAKSNTPKTNKQYLFRNGEIDPRIQLTSSVFIDGGYITSSGNVSLDFAIEDLQDKTLMLSAFNDNAASNDGTRLWIYAINGNNVLKEACAVFSGGTAYNCLKIVGLDFSSFTGYTGQRLSFNCLNKQIKIKEIWYE